MYASKTIVLHNNDRSMCNLNMLEHVSTKKIKTLKLMNLEKISITNTNPKVKP